MKLYIDQANVISLMKSKNQSDFNDCVNLMRKHLDIHFNFPKKALLKDNLLMAWFAKFFGDGVTGKQKFAEEAEVFPPKDQRKSNFYTSGLPELLTSIYLLDDDHLCEVISSKSAILIGKVGEETKLIHSLLLEDTETAATLITSWSDYLPSLPLTDIIICDNHYFKFEEVYRKNNNEIIYSLSNIPNNSPVNVIIITKEGEIDGRLDLGKEQEVIKGLVKKATGSTKSSVTILTTRRSHDRSLITNYYRVKHGSCFHLKDNGLKEDVTTEIKSHAYRKNEEVTKQLLAFYQDIVNRPVNCYGDKKSNFLNF